MMGYRYDLSDTHCKIYYESTPEFEEVRDLCLQEDNWLRNNYIKENLKLEEHTGYGVLYQTSTGKPMVMGGVFNDGRYPSNVAKQINRLYTFPDFRMTATDMTDGFRCTCKLIAELEAVNNYEVYLITMQNRKARPNKGYWKVWRKHMDIASNGAWNEGAGYIQTCPYPVQKCWQNFVWQEKVNGAMLEWSPNIIDDTVWLGLEEGK